MLLEMFVGWVFLLLLDFWFLFLLNKRLVFHLENVFTQK